MSKVDWCDVCLCLIQEQTLVDATALLPMPPDILHCLNKQFTQCLVRFPIFVYLTICKTMRKYNEINKDMEHTIQEKIIYVNHTKLRDTGR